MLLKLNQHPSASSCIGKLVNSRGNRAARRYHYMVRSFGGQEPHEGGDATITRKPELPIIPFASCEAWEMWLEEHHGTSDGLQLKLAKKGSGLETVSLAEALEVALCYGWIDSQADRFDDQHWLLRFTPRRPRSKWSKVNRLKVSKLIEAGRMKPAGLREVERDKAEGRWEEQ